MPSTFDVKLNGEIVLRGVSAKPLTDAAANRIVEVPAVRVTDNLLIEFLPQFGTPIVNAIEVQRKEAKSSR
jgi:hypothetical protein